MNGNSWADDAVPDWMPLATHLEPPQCGDFMWMYRLGPLNFYKHIVTRRYLALDGDGNCFRLEDGDFRKVDFRRQYRHVTGRT